MKYSALATLVFAVVSLPAFAAVNAVRFDGSVQRAGRPAMHFRLAVPAGETARLTLDGGTTLQFSAAASHGRPAQSTVELLDASGKRLHEARWPGHAPHRETFRYLICDGHAIFASPAGRAAPSSCPS